MSDSIKVFGNVGSPYTQKILALLRYRNISYTVSWGDVVQNLSLLDNNISFKSESFGTCFVSK